MLSWTRNPGKVMTIKKISFSFYLANSVGSERTCEFLVRSTASRVGRSHRTFGNSGREDSEIFMRMVTYFVF